MKTIEHPYKPRPWIMLLATLFFAGVAATMAHAALTNDRGLVLNGVVELSTARATIFYWCIAGIGGVFVLAGLPLFVIGLVGKGYVRLSATELSAPRFGFSRTNTVIPLADIEAIGVQSVRQERFLTIVHGHGTLSISQSCLPNAAAFEELCAALGGPLADGDVGSATAESASP